MSKNHIAEKQKANTDDESEQNIVEIKKIKRTIKSVSNDDTLTNDATKKLKSKKNIKVNENIKINDNNNNKNNKNNKFINECC